MIRNILFILLFLYSGSLFAQISIHDGKPRDSVHFAFGTPDSFKRVMNFGRYIEIDTIGCLLWQTGTTGKPYFSSGGNTGGAIMTDTTNSYPINVDDWFTLKLMTRNANVIISFYHKYQTTAGHDGGIVEFSSDQGSTWNNVMDSCNVSQSTNKHFGVITSNFYSITDTLLSGEWAFNGSSNDFKYSRLQFFNFIPVKKTSWETDCILNDTIFVRFRFKSDDTLESLDGWIIDSLKIEYDDYGSNVDDAEINKLSVFPNPSYDGLVHFPALADEKAYRIELINVLGDRMLNTPYSETLDLGRYSKGVYFYKVTNGSKYYTGHLLLE